MNKFLRREAVPHGAGFVSSFLWIKLDSYELLD